MAVSGKACVVVVAVYQEWYKIKADLKGALIRGRGANSSRGAYQNLKSYGVR